MREYRFREWEFSRLTKTIFSICFPILFSVYFTPQINLSYTTSSLSSIKKVAMVNVLSENSRIFFCCMLLRKRSKNNFRGKFEAFKPSFLCLTGDRAYDEFRCGKNAYIEENTSTVPATTNWEWKGKRVRWKIAFLSGKHYVCKLTMVNVSRVNTFAK